MTEKEKPTAAFILSLIGGIFILLGGGMASMLGYWLLGAYRGGGYGMMGRGFGRMGRFSYGFGLLGLVGLVFGITVIISALMLNSKPEQHSTWGTLIIIFSALSIFGSMMGGFGIGLILGLVGGILAITWKPTQSKSGA